MDGFIVGKGNYAAIPFGKQLMVIHNGEQLKVCRTEASARKFIDDHRKNCSNAKLPIKISEVTKGRIPWNKGKSMAKLPLN